MIKFEVGNHNKKESIGSFTKLLDGSEIMYDNVADHS